MEILISTILNYWYLQFKLLMSKKKLLISKSDLLISIHGNKIMDYQEIELLWNAKLTETRILRELSNSMKELSN